MYPKGKPRNFVVGNFITNLCKEYSAAELARLTGKHEKTIRRWRDQIDNPPEECVYAIIDGLFPLGQGKLCQYNGGPIDGNTRVVGVGQYSKLSAKGVYHDL